MIISHASTIDHERPASRRELMVNDVGRAYFYAKQQRSVFINLPKEDDEAQEGEVGQCCCACMELVTRLRSGNGLFRGTFRK